MTRTRVAIWLCDLVNDKLQGNGATLRESRQVRCVALMRALRFAN